MRCRQDEGFTLAELLVVVAIIGILAAAAVPLLDVHNSKKLEVAAEEVGNALRIAVDRGRNGEYVLVDAKTAPGRLKLLASNASGADLGPVNDPLTKLPLDIDIKGGAMTGPVNMSTAFMQGGTAYAQLLLGPAGQMQVFNGPAANMGALQSGSGIVLSMGPPGVTVTIHELTGLVAIP